MTVPREECGVFGVYGKEQASVHTYLGLYAVQHRGQESAGIVSSIDGSEMFIHKDRGLVADVFDEEILRNLKGNFAIGHVRYSTTGSNLVKNAQPLFARYKDGSLAIAHNGNLTNARQLRTELEQNGAIFQTTTDSEILIHLIAQSTAPTFIDALVASLTRIEGAYSLLIMKDDVIVAVRDPRGFRPLSIGRFGDAFVVASESCAFDIIDAQLIRDVEPGEIVVFSKDGMESLHPFPDVQKSYCVFEYIYYTRPDSVLNGKSVHDIRLKLGAQLADEHPIDADMVIPVPDSSTVAAIGYSQRSGIPFALGLIRNHYIGRTFIEPQQHIRDFGAKIKYNPVRNALRGKRLLVVDDSIVRGTTCAKIVKMLRKAGAKEVHFRVSAPPWKHPCYYGIDTPTVAELIGANHSVEEIGKIIDADTIGYLSVEGLRKVVENHTDYCYACFDGVYPGGKPEGVFKEILEFPTDPGVKLSKK